MWFKDVKMCKDVVRLHGLLRTYLHVVELQRVVLRGLGECQSSADLCTITAIVCGKGFPSPLSPLFHSFLKALPLFPSIAPRFTLEAPVPLPKQQQFYATHIVHYAAQSLHKLCLFWPIIPHCSEQIHYNHMPSVCVLACTCIYLFPLFR